MLAAAAPATASTTRALADQLAEIRGDAAQRGVDFITLRGLAERLHCPETASPSSNATSTRGMKRTTPPRLWKVHPPT